MRSRISLVASLALMLAASFAVADDTTPPATPPVDSLPPNGWKTASNLTLNLSQSTYSANWSGGDRGTIVWVLGTRASAARQFGPHFNLINVVELAYGQTSRQEDNSTNWQSPDKTTDRIALESVGRWTLGGFVDPYLSVGAESQFRDETDPRGTIYLNPVRVMGSTGIARELYHKADAAALARLGFTFGQTFAQSFTDPLGQHKVSYSSNDGGIEFKVDWKQPILQKKVLYTGTFRAYQPLFYSKANDLKTVDQLLIQAYAPRDPIQDYWKTADLGFLNTFTAQVTKSLSVNMVVQWIYDKFDVAANVDPTLAASTDLAVRDAYRLQIDKNVRKAGQFKETLALGFTYLLF